MNTCKVLLSVYGTDCSSTCTCTQYLADHFRLARHGIKFVLHLLTCLDPSRIDPDFVPTHGKATQPVKE